MRSYIAIIKHQVVSGGKTISVKDTMKQITVQVKLGAEARQTLRTLINNQKQKIPSDVIYAPREGVSLRTSSPITEEIIKAKDKHQNINNSSFNGKLGHKIHGNMSTVTKGGMKIVNQEQETCNGL